LSQGASHNRASISCRNCGAPAPGKYCPSCGQETALHPPTVWEFVHHFITHYVAAEGKLWATLAKLLAPGRLTLEYLQGRRARYIHPLRLYLTFSVILFLVIKLSGASLGVSWKAEDAAMPIKPGVTFAPEGRDKDDAKGVSMNARITAEEDDPQWVKDLAAELARADDPQWRKTFHKTVLGYVPYALMLLVPLLALYLKGLYRKRGVMYGEHFVFAMHVQTVLFILLLLPLVLRFEIVATIATLAFPVYLVVALKRVYGGRWWATVLRGLLVYATYLVSAGLAVVLVMALALLFG
jgi:Protein of unknown function (DUF3667)